MFGQGHETRIPKAGCGLPSLLLLDPLIVQLNGAS